MIINSMFEKEPKGYQFVTCSLDGYSYGKAHEQVCSGEHTSEIRYL